MRNIGDMGGGLSRRVVPTQSIDDLPVLQSSPFVERGQTTYAVEKAQITLRHPGALHYVASIGYVFGLDSTRREIYFSEEGLKDGQGVFATARGHVILRSFIIQYEILSPSGTRTILRL